MFLDCSWLFRDVILSIFRRVHSQEYLLQEHLSLNQHTPSLLNSLFVYQFSGKFQEIIQERLRKNQETSRKKQGKPRKLYYSATRDIVLFSYQGVQFTEFQNYTLVAA